MALIQGFTLASSVVFICLVWAAGRFTAFYKDRCRYQKLPGPPGSPMFGHLLAIGKVAQTLPKRAHPHILAAQLMRAYDLPSVFYLDTRPASVVSMIITDPDCARQVVEADLLKHPAVAEVLEPFAGKINLVTASGPQWKKWRSVFNPGFSVQHLVGQVPMMVDSCQKFVRTLDQHASSDRVFRLEEEATKLTIDIIGKAICDHDFEPFEPNNLFVSWMRGILSWSIDQQSINPFHRYSLLRPLAVKYYRGKLSTYVGKILDDRFGARVSAIADPKQGRSGIDLALEVYVKEYSNNPDVNSMSMSAEFRKAAVDNLLVLLFAGHDTTASTLCYCYNLLSHHPHTLAAARQELDSVFGVGVSATDRLKKDPFLVNKLDYILAVIKEVLRLWSPASTARLGRKGFFIRDPGTGEMLPTEGINVWIPSFAIGRSKRIWGEDVDEFKPERFLPENIASIPADAWRPFEKGNRNCIGQELSLIEIKTVLALTLREFDMRSALDELASLSDDGSLWTKDGSFRKGPQEVFGDPMYQVLLAAGKPREGMPARVKRRKHY